MGSMMDKAITALVEKEVRAAVMQHHQMIIRKFQEDDYNVRRFQPHKFVELYCQPECCK